MHQSSLENMQKCFDRYIWDDERFATGPLKLLDVGGANVNGSYGDVFHEDRFTYLGADLSAGPGVSIVLDDPNRLPLEDNSIDVVISGQMLEHCANFWLVFAEMTRVLKPDGYLFLIAPSAGPIHKYPVDCYRFYPDAYQALADHAGCHLIDCWMDNRGPWNDLVGVFSKVAKPKIAHSDRPFTRAADVNTFAQTSGGPEELVQGKRPYLETLADIHTHLQPRSYLEIGVRKGNSLALAACPAVGVDPDPEISAALPATSRIVQQTSDAFFEQGSDPALSAPLDIVFIDGMHLFEYALRDFMNAEKMCHAGSVIVIDDILPNHPEQATRERRSRVWMGDIWKLPVLLKEFRPDLTLTLLDTSPSGLLLITGLDPTSRVLWDKYNPITRRARYKLEAPDQTILERTDALDPTSDQARRFMSSLSRGETRPKVSVIVIAYNMARELPRTLQTLSPAMQHGLTAEDVEIILVDNGSSEPFDKAAIEAIAPNIRAMRVDTGSVSPVGAINLGLKEARADLIGVMIDGARMASPGLLAQAVEASRLHPRPVIGTIAFHLGEKVQMQSVLEGYNQAAEDVLLSTVPWQEDGYRLFDISVLAGSSSGGWLQIPSETNALFMPRAIWTELSGYDEAFQTRGGGYVNLDTWKRACELADAQIIMLLGEATFHQFHGGVATNATVSPRDEFVAEYLRIRGVRYRPPQIQPILHGQFHGKQAIDIGSAR